MCQGYPRVCVRQMVSVLPVRRTRPAQWQVCSVDQGIIGGLWKTGFFASLSSSSCRHVSKSALDKYVKTAGWRRPQITSPPAQLCPCVSYPLCSSVSSQSHSCPPKLSWSLEKRNLIMSPPYLKAFSGFLLLLLWEPRSLVWPKRPYEVTPPSPPTMLSEGSAHVHTCTIPTCLFHAAVSELRWKAISIEKPSRQSRLHQVLCCWLSLYTLLFP